MKEKVWLHYDYIYLSPKGEIYTEPVRVVFLGNVILQCSFTSWGICSAMFETVVFAMNSSILILLEEKE